MFAIRLPERGLLFIAANYLLALSVFSTVTLALTGFAGLSDGFIHLDIPRIESFKEAMIALRLQNGDGKVLTEPERVNLLINASGRPYDAKSQTTFAACSETLPGIAGMQKIAAHGLPTSCAAYTTTAMVLPAQVFPLYATDKVAFLSGDRPVVDITRTVRFVQMIYTYVPIALLGLVIIAVQCVGFTRLLATSANRIVFASSFVPSIILFNTFASHPNLALAAGEFAFTLAVCNIFVAAAVVGFGEPIATSLLDWYTPGRTDDEASFPLGSAILYWITGLATLVFGSCLVLFIWQSVFAACGYLLSVFSPGWLATVIEVATGWKIWSLAANLTF